MKRRSLILAFALLLAVSAALVGANYRLNNPPLTDADKQFRALVADADKVEFTNLELLAPGGDTISYSRDLNVAQTRELVEKIRFLPLATASNLSTRTAYVLAFYRQNRDLARFDIGQTPPKLAPPSTIFAREGQIRYILNPRFEKQLQLYLRKLEKLPISVISS